MTDRTTDSGFGAPLLSLRGMNKSFGAVHVLKDAGIDAWAGKVTALVGDNGAGKSTLVKGMAGIYSFDSGDYRFDGQTVHVHSPKQSAALGIEVVYQDLALCVMNGDWDRAELIEKGRQAGDMVDVRVSEEDCFHVGVRVSGAIQHKARLKVGVDDDSVFRVLIHDQV